MLYLSRGVFRQCYVCSFSLKFNCKPLARFTSKMPSRSNTSGDHKVFDRLPTVLVPKLYDITLKPDLEKFTFDGSEKINVLVKQPTEKILLNALDMNIKSATFKGSLGKVIKAEDIQLCTQTEIATIKFAAPLDAGDGELSLEFVGNLNDKMKGFYRSKYTTPEGKEKYAAVTQFEPTDARRAFPCWDEPAVKAKFNLTLIVPKDKVALSNMNEVSVESDKNTEYKVVKFDTSPIMSTYLVAAVIGDYDYVEGKTEEGVKVRVYTPTGKAEMGRFSLDVALKSLTYFNKYFNIPFPLPKMDLIGIADFSAGAMENWGLITFREQRVLVDAQNTSAYVKQRIAITVAHELAHQWFGNLVTMEWWTHLWLNEGFASFMEFLAVDDLFPEYDIWTQFVTDQYSSALDLDGLHNSHPIEVPVGDPSEVEEIFDDISYCKGASVIRMLHNFVGDENFRKGLHNYLSKHAYKNALTEDLWASLEDVSKKSVGNMMSTWTKQMGYPGLTVSARQDGPNVILSVSQEKFCANGILSDSDKAAMWVVPISVLVQGDAKPRLTTLLESRSTEIVVENVKPGQWIKLNPRAVDFYRVHYSAEMLALMLPAIKDKSMAPLDRLNLQNDIFALVQAGKASTVELLTLLEAFVNEDNFTVWDSINSCLGKLNTLLSHTDFQNLLHTSGRKLLSKIYAKVGWEPAKNEGHLDTLLRPIILGRLVSFNDPEVIEKAKERFEGHVNKKFVLPADIRGVVYRAVAAHGDDKTFDALFKLHAETELHEEKNRILSSFGNATTPSRIQRVLEYALSKDVRNQDCIFAMGSVAMNNRGRDAAWKFFQDNSRILKERFESGFLMKTLVKYTTENFASEEKAVEVEQFFAKNPHAGTERTVQQSLESIRLKAAWLARDSGAIKTFLQSQDSK